MKKSNIALIALFSLILIVLLGSNLVLKAEFDKIDRNDPMYGYRVEFAKPFKYVRLQGKSVGVTEIHPGKRFEISGMPEKKYYDWKVIGDTLVFNYKSDWDQIGSYREDNLNSAPSFYISAPEVKGITSHNVAVVVKNWKSGDMSIKMENGVLLLSDNSLENLKTDVQSGGFVKIDGKNRLGSVAIEVRDSSSLKVEKDIFKSFKANVDTTAHINLPGSLFKNIE